MPIPEKEKDTVVLLHPATMQFCGFCIAEKCIVSKSKILTLWPCSSINLTTVGLSEAVMNKLGIVKGGLVSVEHFVDSQQVTEEISVVPG